jgi:hypothetical protein
VFSSTALFQARKSNIENTQVTDAGVERLQKTRPKVRISH